MPSSSKLIDLSLAEFVGRVAEADPVPASGCVAAAGGALGSALVSMALRVSSGDPACEIAAYQLGRAEELGELAQRFLELVDEDARAYHALMGARAARKDEPEGLPAAWRGAVEVPFEVAETALAALRIAAVGAPAVAPRVATELALGASSLRAALEGALAIARANVRDCGAPEGFADQLQVAQGLERRAAELCGSIAEAGGANG